MISERISKDIPHQMKISKYGYPHSNELPQSPLKLECCKPHKAARHPTKYDVINDIKLFPTVYRRIYCCKLLCYPTRRRITKASALELRQKEN